MKVFTIIFVVIPLISAENILRLDLSPEEAQKYLQGSSSVLNYAKKLGEIELPHGKNTYYRGRAIEHPEEFVERTYLAHQFHGQDGLGKAKFGYTDWNQARFEDIDVHGKTEGSYQYVDPKGENIVVKYWADSEGFHQTDNRKVQTVTDTPEVRAARAAHEKAWKEAAAANKAYGSNYAGSSSENNNNYEGRVSQNNGQYAGSSSENNAKYAGRSSGNNGNYAGRVSQNNGQYAGSSSENNAKYAGHTSENNGQYAGRNSENNGKYVPRDEDGPTGPPRGFFYQFDYEVPLIVRKDEPEP